jgi:hypothetical protein
MDTGVCRMNSKRIYHVIHTTAAWGNFMRLENDSQGSNSTRCLAWVYAALATAVTVLAW